MDKHPYDELIHLFNDINNVSFQGNIYRNNDTKITRVYHMSPENTLVLDRSHIYDIEYLLPDPRYEDVEIYDETNKDIKTVKQLSYPENEIMSNQHVWITIGTQKLFSSAPLSCSKSQLGYCKYSFDNIFAKVLTIHSDVPVTLNITSYDCLQEPIMTRHYVYWYYTHIFTEKYGIVSGFVFSPLKKRHECFVFPTGNFTCHTIIDSYNCSHLKTYNNVNKEDEECWSVTMKDNTINKRDTIDDLLFHNTRNVFNIDDGDDEDDKDDNNDISLHGIHKDRVELTELFVSVYYYKNPILFNGYKVFIQLFNQNMSKLRKPHFDNPKHIYEENIPRGFFNYRTQTTDNYIHMLFEDFWTFKSYPSEGTRVFSYNDRHKNVIYDDLIINNTFYDVIDIVDCCKRKPECFSGQLYNYIISICEEHTSTEMRDIIQTAI